ncbi:MAG TPA: isoprenylcysteine carboxylmethyltransferase family protein, partial [Alicycliphilus sp.]|nr:isoprenylcysteine carboxylmethyltransferase family protein [Alicycliphilus sp.]
MFNLEHKIPPPVVGLACAGLAWWLAGAAPALALHWPGHLGLAVALLLGLAGLALELWGLQVFRRHRTTPNP